MLALLYFFYYRFLRRASAPDMALASTFPCNAASARENDDAIHLYAAVASNRATAAVVRLLRGRGSPTEENAYVRDIRTRVTN
jgi:hypothetical protein